MPETPSDLPLEVAVREVAELRAHGDSFLFLDCREAEEHATVHIAGTTLLPMSELAQRFVELEPNRHDRVIVHCHHGGRSLQVTRWLRNQGFPRVQSMAGGIDQWATDVEPGMTRY